MSRVEIAAEAAHLEPGQSMRTVCPFCGGGSSNERTLSIKLDADTGLLLYHCFRGNCGESGVVGGNRLGNLIRIRPEKPKQKPPFDDSHVFGLDDIEGSGRTAAMSKLAEWGLGLMDYRWGYDRSCDRLAIPVYGPMAELRGYVLRALFPWQKPKALTGVIRREDPFVSWHFPTSHLRYGFNVLVEDIPSAIRLAQCGAPAIAALGNTPSGSVLDELARESGGSKLVIAFDPDATAQALRVQRQYGLRGESIVLVLTKDFKNMTNTEAKDCLASVT